MGRDYDARRQDIVDPHPHTCNWLFETLGFRTWRDRSNLSQHNGVLWIKGKPGTGKSTLMKHALAHCQSIEQFRGCTIVAHFFNATGVDFEKTSLGMLHSITYQLIKEDSSLYDRFIARFRKKAALLRSKEVVRWRENELKEFILGSIPDSGARRMLLIVDALDECAESEVREVVAFLGALSIKACSPDSRTSLHVLLSSRHYPHITMGKCEQIVVEENRHHVTDISTYVGGNLIARDDAVERELVTKSSGIFLWVVLMVAILNRAYDEGRLEAMHQKLDEIPGDLEMVFDTLLNKDNPNKSETVIMLQWVLFSREPLEPRTLFLLALVGIIPPDQFATLRRTVIARMTTEDIRRRIIASSRGLVEMGSQGTAQFIHTCVSDFLVREGRLQRLDPTLQTSLIGLSHDRLRRCCSMTYSIDLPGWLRDPCRALKYVMSNVFHHAEAAEQRGISQVEFINHVLKPDVGRYLCRGLKPGFGRYPFHVLDPDFEETRILLHTLVHSGFPSLVRVVVRTNGIDLDEPDLQSSYSKTALQVAIQIGQWESAKILIQHGANVNARGGILGTALHVAITSGATELVEMLVANGADVNKPDEHIKATALQWACRRDEEQMVRIMLQYPAVNVDAPAGTFGTALYAAALAGNLRTLKALLYAGAQVNIPGGRLGTPLQAALCVGNLAAATVLERER